MKKISLIKAISLFFLVLFVSASVIQCKKEGDIVKNLDRAFKGSADTTVYASFYENNTISTANTPADVNDIIKFRGVQTILHEYCATSNCHGGPIGPKFDSYADVMKFVAPGSPEGSKLWEFLTTDNLDKAMPPVNSNHEMSITDKSIIYNWIKNGAKERPDLNDFRPAAIAIITSGCASVNCHSDITATGAWARKGLLGPLAPADSSSYTFTDLVSGATKTYCLLNNATIRIREWGTAESPVAAPYSYKDSVKKFYADTVANATFRPFKTFTTPWISPSPYPSIRGPLNTYDDILLDIMYPKSVRSNSSVQYTDPVTLNQYYVKGNYLNSSSSLIQQIDSTLIMQNPYTLAWGNPGGRMAYDDGGLKPHEIALIKAWYFADPNVPTVWKYGNANAGIFQYRKGGKIIKQ